mgnify:CR=1 FL=1
MGHKLTIHSMTGFARVEERNQLCSWNWELKSYNGKSLAIRCRLPKGLEHLESPICEHLRERIYRGNLNVNLSVQWLNTDSGYNVNELALNRVLKNISVIERKLHNAGPISASDILLIPGVLNIADRILSKNEQKIIDIDIVESFFFGVTELERMRSEEGSHLQVLICEHFEKMELLISKAEKTLEALPDIVKDRLSRSIDEYIGSHTEIPEERVLQEIALLILKSDPKEELDRLKSHHASALRLLEKSKNIGRQLEFLCQEMHREINTFCSKSGSLNMTKIGLDLKLVIDRIREQMQNIE